ncbi:MAG: hypothetical protein WC444_01770 [Candidatus Paceibacterota bacterium]
MLNVSRSMPDIAVLRGGNHNFKTSLAEGAEVLISLTKIGYKPLDVVIDTEGKWTLQGLPTDAHYIFTIAHTVVDTTRMKGEAYQALAKDMGIPLLFSRAHEVTMDREDMYRVLRQQGIKVPETVVVRASAPLKDSLFRELWSTYHTPLMVRPLVRTAGAPSRLIKLFTDLETIIRDYHAKGIDTHVLTYKKAPTSSIAALPDFRGEKLYTPLWVETFASLQGIPNEEAPMRAHVHAPEWKKEQMKKFVTQVYEALDLTGPVCIDMISHADGYTVVNIDTAPSLRKDGRFMQSLATTGVDAGQYVHSRIEHELKR